MRIFTIFEIKLNEELLIVTTAVITFNYFFPGERRKEEEKEEEEEEEAERRERRNRNCGTIMFRGGSTWRAIKSFRSSAAVRTFL